VSLDKEDRGGSEYGHERRGGNEQHGHERERR
jgi:hypothetical protein